MARINLKPITTIAEGPNVIDLLEEERTKKENDIRDNLEDEADDDFPPEHFHDDFQQAWPFPFFLLLWKQRNSSKGQVITASYYFFEPYISTLISAFMLSFSHLCVCCLLFVWVLLLKCFCQTFFVTYIFYPSTMFFKVRKFQFRDLVTTHLFIVRRQEEGGGLRQHLLATCVLGWSTFERILQPPSTAAGVVQRDRVLLILLTNIIGGVLWPSYIFCHQVCVFQIRFSFFSV